MTVQEILMRRGGRVIVVNRRAPVANAIEMMLREGVGALVVGRNGCEIEGLVSQREIIRALVSKGLNQCLPMAVADIMSWPVDTCRSDDSLRRVLATMTRRRVRHMAVVKNGDLCGLVSIGDIVRYRLEEAETEARVARKAVMFAR